MKMQPPADVDNKYVLFALFFALSNRLQTIGDSFFSEISTKQWFVLLMLNTMNGYSPTLSELSEAVGSSHQNVKQLVMKLESKGYVELYKDEEDARRLRIKTTSKSEELNEAYNEKSSIFIEKLFNHLEEVDLLTTKNTMLTLIETLETLEKDYVKR